MRIRLSILLFAVSLSLGGAEPRAKNIILFIGDAAGIATIHGAAVHSMGKGLGLYLHSMPHMALVDTATASEWVADSAASGTALATGQKTHNGVIAQDASAVRGRSDGASLKTILEYSEEKGLATGVVSNSSVLSATPAAFYAHVNDRSDIQGILAQLLKPSHGDGVDVVIGAGADDIIEAAAALKIDPDAAMRERRLTRYEALHAMPRDAASGSVIFNDEFDLSAATEAAVRMLSRDGDGFFLMVESDCHTEEVVQGFERVIALDKAVQRATELVDMSETLIIVTADHSYDFRIHDGEIGEPIVPPEATSDWGDNLDAMRTGIIRRDDDHTGEYVLALAQGPGGERIKGFIEQRNLFDIMMAAYGWRPGD